KPVKRELQNDFGRARRPGPLAFDILETFEKTADIKQQAAEFGTGCVERLMHALARGDHGLGEACSAIAAGAAASRRYRARPIRRRARHHMSAGEIGAQSLAGLKLMRFDQGAPIPSAPARKPG